MWDRVVFATPDRPPLMVIDTRSPYRFGRADRGGCFRDLELHWGGLNRFLSLSR
jgi:hypothetical protein